MGGSERRYRSARPSSRKAARMARLRRKRILTGVCAGALVLLLILVISFAAGRSSSSGAGKARETGNLALARTDDTLAGAETSVRVGTEEDPPGQAGETGSVTEDAGPDDAGASSADGNEALPQEPVSLTITVVGDCTFGMDETFDYSTSFNSYYENYGPDYFLKNVKDIFEGDDLTIANCETTLTTAEEHRQDTIYQFKADPDCVRIFTGSSVEAVTTANNHSQDFFEEGYKQTLKTLDDAGVINVGYEKTAVVDVKGVKVGLIGMYELIDHLGSADLLKKNIEKVRSEGAQLIVVIFHWGNELDLEPDSNQLTLGRMAVDLGADLVCGHHAHVIQGIENYKGVNICYGLGNFCFGGNVHPTDMDTIIFQQTFTVTPDGVGRDNVTNIIPCIVSSDPSYNNYQPTPAEGEDAARILNKLKERSEALPV